MIKLINYINVRSESHASVYGMDQKIPDFRAGPNVWDEKSAGRNSCNPLSHNRRPETFQCEGFAVCELYRSAITVEYLLGLNEINN